MNVQHSVRTALLTLPESRSVERSICPTAVHVLCSGTTVFRGMGNFSRAAEFAHFCGISMFSQNFAEFGTGR